MINVWCVCVGDKYGEEDVRILRNMIDRHLSLPHDFYVLSDRQRGDFNCIIPDEKWPGWWSKLLLFRYAFGQVLYLDLDVVVVGSLDYLISEQLSMAANWAQSGHGGCQSSVMSWHADHDAYFNLVKEFDLDQLGKPDPNGNCPHYGLYNGLWGDQEYITQKLGDPGSGKVKKASGIYSYKYHCRDKGLPDDAAVICFHGYPKPSEVSETWVKVARSSTAILGSNTK